MRPVCRWCYVLSRHRRNGPVGSLRVAFACARTGHHHPSVRAAVRNGSTKVTVVLEDKARLSLPRVPRVVIDEMLVAAERILAES